MTRAFTNTAAKNQMVKPRWQVFVRADGLVMDQGDIAEHREIKTDHHSAYPDSHKDGEERLEKGRQVVDCRLDLFVVELRDLVQHGVERTGLLPTSIIWTTRRGLRPRARGADQPAGALSDSLLRGPQRISHDPVPCSIGAEIQRLENRHTQLISDARVDVTRARATLWNKARKSAGAALAIPLDPSFVGADPLSKSHDASYDDGDDQQHPDTGHNL